MRLYENTKTDIDASLCVFIGFFCPLVLALLYKTFF